jgi:hypothetical protein
VDLELGDGKVGMKRQWNWRIWLGFVIAVGGLFSYEFFVRFPITRDFPWANLLLFAIGAALLVVGLFRAFGRSQLYRGKIFDSILTAIAKTRLYISTAFGFQGGSHPALRCVASPGGTKRRGHCPTRRVSD